MSFEKALRDELVKVIPAVYPLTAPENTQAPYVVYVSSYGDRDLTLDGYQTTKEVDVMVHVVGRNYADMKTYTNGVLNAMSGWQGKKIGTDLIYIQSVHYKNPTEVADPVTFMAHSWVDMTIRF